MNLKSDIQTTAWPWKVKTNQLWIWTFFFDRELPNSQSGLTHFQLFMWNEMVGGRDPTRDDWMRPFVYYRLISESACTVVILCSDGMKHLFWLCLGKVAQNILSVRNCSPNWQQFPQQWTIFLINFQQYTQIRKSWGHPF